MSDLIDQAWTAFERDKPAYLRGDAPERAPTSTRDDLPHFERIGQIADKDTANLIISSPQWTPRTPEEQDLTSKLLKIVREGHEETKVSISKNLERFHLLTRLLNGEVSVGEAAKPTSEEAARNLQTEVARINQSLDDAAKHKSRSDARVGKPRKPRTGT